MTNELHTLNGLGPKSVYQLKSIGVYTRTDLVQQGAVPVYLQLKQHSKTISLNFLYALAGAIEDKHWREIAATRREELLLQIEGQQTLAALTPTLDNNNEATL